MFLLVPLDKWAEISGCTDLQLTHYKIKQPTVGLGVFWICYFRMEIAELAASLTI